MDFKSSVFLLGIATSIAAGAYAEQEVKADAMAEDPAPTFSELDADESGSISLSEAEGTWLAEMFTLVDANEDGLVSEVEYTEAMS
ncbi:MAG: EF-hand domain-containing protein [Pseudomonadota bacterium]